MPDPHIPSGFPFGPKTESANKPDSASIPPS